MRIGRVLGFFISLTMCGWAQMDTTPARYGIVVGTASDDLPGPNQDACALAKVLAAVGGFRPSDIILLSTPGTCNGYKSSRPTTKQISVSIREITGRMRADDLLFFFFSGHGEFAAGQARLLTADDGLTEGSHSALRLAELLELLGPAATGSRKLVVALDACRNSSRASTPQETLDLDAGVNAMVDSFSGSHPAIEGAILFGTETGAFSYSRALNPVGYFTWAMIKGLIGEASDKQGVVRMGALAKYIQETVPELIRFDLQINTEPPSGDGPIRQHPEVRQIGRGIDDYEISKTSPRGSNFYFSGEVYMLSRDGEGRKGDLERRVDFISARVGLSEALPLGDVMIVPGLQLIDAYHDQLPAEESLDWLVKFTTHFGRMHRTYVLCAEHPERNGVKIKLNGKALEVNALMAFSAWGRQMADLEDMRDNGELPDKSSIETECSLRVSPPVQ